MVEIKGFSSRQIGERIRAIRKLQNISVQQMANDIYMSPNGIYRLETGRVYPSLVSAVIISAYLSVSLDYLLLGEE